MIKIREGEKAIVGLRDDGFYHIFIKEWVIIDEKVQDEAFSLYLELLGKQKGLVIIEIGDHCKMRKSARPHSDVIHLKSPTIARAIYAQNKVYRMALNFYYRLTDVKDNYKIVMDFKEGIRFLEEYRPQAV